MHERKIVQIDAEKCNGCGICVNSCAEGAIQMVDGKAKLVSDNYCDGLGACLGPCPTGAISIITRKADAFDAEAAEKHVERLRGGMQKEPAGAALRNALDEESATPTPPTLGCGCPGSMSRSLKQPAPMAEACGCGCGCADEDEGGPAQSELMNWPVQLKLVPAGAPYLKNADILLAADCAAVAAPDFHRRFLHGRPVIIACPKLEENEPQVRKLAEIIQAAHPASITVLRMEVPCCGGLVRIAEEAIRRAGGNVPLHKVVLGIDGGVQ